MNDNVFTRILLIAMNVAEQIIRFPFQMLYFLWTGILAWWSDLAGCFDLSNYDADGDEPADGDKPAVEKKIGFHK